MESGFSEHKKALIQRALHNDKQAIITAQARATKHPKWNVWTKSQQRQAMEEAAFEKIEQRKRDGRHVGSYFPVFREYISPLVYGQTGRDSSLEALMSKQIRRLRDPSSVDSEDEDGELPPAMLKTTKTEDESKLCDIPPYVAEHKNRSNGIKKQDDVDATKQGKIKNEHSGEDAGEEEESDNDEDEESEDERPPLVAVSRGRPTAELDAMPSKTLQAMKQHFSTCTPSTTKAMIRGQITDVDDGKRIWHWSGEEGWIAVKKRKRSRESHKDDSQSAKKAKVNRRG